MEALQLALDRAVQAPQWAGFALLALALAVTIPGRHGQRVLNGALLGAAAFSLAFFGLRPFHPWLPGVAAVIAGTVATLGGALAPAWGTALVLALLFGTVAGTCAHLVGLHWFLAGVPAFGFGLLAGIRRQLRVSLLLPPIFAGLFAALGAAVAFAPNSRGAILYPLNDVRWTLALSPVLIAPLLALSLWRERRTRTRLAARTRQMDDDDLEKALAKKRARAGPEEPIPE